MEQKTLYFVMISIGLCALGIFVLIFGFSNYRQQDLTLNLLSIIIFSKVAPPFPTDIFSVFPPYYPYYSFELYFELLDFYFSIYTILFETIKESIHPILVSSLLPLIGTVTLSFGGIFVALTAISVRQEVIEPNKKGFY